MSNAFEKLAKKIGIVVQAGGILNIENFYTEGQQQLSRPRNEKTLIRIVRREVYHRLNQTVDSQFIILDKELQPQLVTRPWDSDIKLRPKDSQFLHKQTAILELFNRGEVGGELLILGNPGAGKTTTLVELAKSLLEGFVEADPTYPIPILLDLSSWRNEKFSKWLSAEISDRYRVLSSLGMRWIVEKRLLLLMDGLDELKAELQEPCIKAINSFLASELRPEYVVICCRNETYEQLNCRLHLNAAVRLGALSPFQIKSYLYKIGQHDFWSEISQDSKLLDLISTPLMLRVISLIYPRISRAELKKIRITESIPGFLWDAYISELLESNSASKIYSHNNIPSERDVRQWLIWLAKILEKESKTEFLIEKLQPSDLPTRLRRAYQWQLRILKGVIGGGVFFILGGLAGEVLGDSNLQLFLLLFGLFVGSMSALSSKTQMKVLISEALGWSWPRASLGLFSGGIIFFFGQKILNALEWAWIGGKTDVTISLSIVIVVGLMQGMVTSEIEEKSFPNQGIWRTIQASAAKMLLICVSCFLISGIFAYRTSGVFAGLIIGLPTGIGLSLIWLLLDISSPPKGQGSTENCAKHLILRTIISRQNFAPWNYAQFLAYATEKVIIQRVGGRYRFVHKQLQEHFAAMPLDKP